MIVCVMTMTIDVFSNYTVFKMYFLFLQSIIL